MKPVLASLAAASLLPFALHAQTTGVSHPESLDDPISTSSTPSTDHYRKPSAGTPVRPADDMPVAVTPDGTPINARGVAAPAPDEALPATAPGLHTARPVDPADVNSGVVIAVHARPNEIPQGTLLRVALDVPLSTATSRPGDRFTGHLLHDIKRDGRVLLPAGSLVKGRVTQVRASRHFLADAMMRIQPDSITAPDGVLYPLSAQLIDFDHAQDAHYDTRITQEGEIVTDPHTKTRLGALGLTTGGTTAAGALIGGGVGAVIGATVGVGANAIMWAKQDHQQRIAAGTILILDVDHSLFLTPVAVVPPDTTLPNGNE